MTNADVRDLIASAATRDITLNDYEASIVLGAKEILEREPDNADAREVVANFATYMATGEEPRSFTEFRLPEECMYTVEEKAEQQRSRDAYLKATGQHA
jgi:hypothetical protein